MQSARKVQAEREGVIQSMYQETNKSLNGRQDHSHQSQDVSLINVYHIKTEGNILLLARCAGLHYKACSGPILPIERGRVFVRIYMLSGLA